MAYDNPIVKEYRFNAVDFDEGVGASDVIEVPDGLAGRVRKVRLENITVAFDDGTSATGPIIQIGDGSDVDKYFDSGEIIAENYTTTAGIGVVEIDDDGAQVDIERDRTNVTLTCNAAAAGTGDGTADVVVEIEWF